MPVGLGLGGIRIPQKAMEPDALNSETARFSTINTTACLRLGQSTGDPDVAPPQSAGIGHGPVDAGDAGSRSCSERGFFLSLCPIDGSPAPGKPHSIPPQISPSTEASSATKVGCPRGAWR